ncbi:hypothetical protein TWF696_004338 [Orbilia brochopaga]|uniref:Uncharacterized protein n=1 Tax=Orbilia brochopaga TaxID=3140254 RepID=A0AAV9V8U2_9PEZI
MLQKEQKYLEEEGLLDGFETPPPEYIASPSIKSSVTNTRARMSPRNIIKECIIFILHSIMLSVVVSAIINQVLPVPWAPNTLLCFCGVLILFFILMFYLLRPLSHALIQQWVLIWAIPKNICQALQRFGRAGEVVFEELEQRTLEALNFKDEQLQPPPEDIELQEILVDESPSTSSQPNVTTRGATSRMAAGLPARASGHVRRRSRGGSSGV